MPMARPTLTELISRCESDISTSLGVGKLLRRSVLGVLARVQAGSVHLLYGYIDWVIKQVFASTAEAEYLELQASEYGISRKSASYAVGNVGFIGIDGSVIAAGTRLQRSDGAIFDMTAEVIAVAPGTTTVAVRAISAGESGNTNSGVTLTLTSPIAGVASVATVAVGGIGSGADAESDESLRARVLTRKRQPPHGGASFDYEVWAKEVAGVTRAFVYGRYLGPGTVGVAILADDAEDGPIPDSELVDTVQDYIEARRPVTADVTVFAPVAKLMNCTIHVSPATEAVKAAVEAELTDMLRRDAVPGGPVLLSRIREAVSIAAGESDNAVTVPSANFTTSAGEIAVLGAIAWS